MQKTTNILYRGPLLSCNYDCTYCPFAKKKDSRETLAYDQVCLNRFVDWTAQQERPIGILFTPWGEALIRRYYQQAMIQLSHLPQVKKVAIQTNLSCKLDWLKEADKTSIALWTTFHPTQTSISKFVDQCQKLIDQNITFSVGIVGKLENFESATALRKALPANIYVWVNAFKRQVDYYTQKDIDFLHQIDPLFSLNNTIYQTNGKACSAGESSISVDGEGNITRCHFIKEKIGNIYNNQLNDLLRPSNCTNTSCRCYIGYMNLKELELDKVYGQQILERIPQ